MIAFWLNTIICFFIIFLFYLLKQKIDDFKKSRGVYIAKKKHDVTPGPKKAEIYTINRNYINGKPLPKRKKNKY
jgi:hypothetical protein